MVKHLNVWFDPTTSAGIPKTADVVIIGGGLAGINLLYGLVSSGLSNVCLVEASSTGFHASGRCIGQLAMKGNSSLFADMGEEYLKFVLSNNSIFLRGLRKINFDVGFKECGGLYLANSEAELANLERESTFIEKVAKISCPILSSKELAVVMPNTAFFGAMYSPSECFFNPHKLINALKTTVEKFIFPHSHVESVLRNNDNTFNIYVRHRGTIKAKKVVYCTGAYTELLLPHLKHVLTPCRGQIIATEPLEAGLFPAMNVFSNNTSEYMRLANDQLLVGGMRSSIRGHQENILDDGDISVSVYDRLRGFIAETFPRLKDAKINQSWSYIMTNTSDGLPLVGELPERANEYIMAGFNEHGPAHIINSSVIMRDCLTGQDYAKLFDPGRFTNV